MAFSNAPREAAQAAASVLSESKSLDQETQRLIARAIEVALKSYQSQLEREARNHF